MTLVADVRNSPNIFNLVAFPNIQIPYRATPNDKPFFTFHIYDINTQEAYPLFVQEAVLKKIGFITEFFDPLRHFPQVLGYTFSEISAPYQQLQKALPIAREHFVQADLQKVMNNSIKIAQMIQINSHSKNNEFCLQKQDDMPKMYFIFGKEAFLNVPKSLLGEGAFAKVKLSMYVTTPNPDNILVAKKTLKNTNLSSDNPAERKKAIWAFNDFTKEQIILRKLMNKRGIISLIANGTFDGKSVMFLPLYTCSLSNHNEKKFDIYAKDVPKMMSQLLEGLKTTSIYGRHNDIAKRNILLRRDSEGKIESVLSDYGLFQPHDGEKHPFSCHNFLPPEYYANNVLSPKLDVWALGLVLYELCTQKKMPHASLKKEEMAAWTAGLKPGWVLKACPPRLYYIPAFVTKALNAMLDPREEQRPTAEEIHESYEADYLQWLNSDGEGTYWRNDLWRETKMKPLPFQPDPLEPLPHEVELEEATKKVHSLEDEDQPTPLKKRKSDETILLR